MLNTTLNQESKKIQEKIASGETLTNGVAGRLGFGGGGQAPISCPLTLVNCGVDTLVLSFKSSVPSALINKLKESKLEVQETTENCQYLPFGNPDLFAWNLQRTGAKLFPFVLKTGDITLFMSSRSEKSSISSMQLSVGSLSCQDDLPKTLEMFKKWCKHYKITIVEEMVSRIDLCADMATAITPLSLWNQAKMVTRAEKVAIYYSNRKLSGVQVGSGDVVLRMYDKIQEMTDKQAGHKMDFFQKKWGNVPELTRVEFQLRRESIKSLCPEITDFKTVSAKIPHIWRYLTTNWFRQTAKSVDRLNRNQSRETNSEFWLSVQAAFDAFSFPAVVRNRKLKTINIKALIDQAAGIMLTVCAGLGHAHSDLFGIMATAAASVQDRLAAVMETTSFERDFRSRVVGAVVSF